MINNENKSISKRAYTKPDFTRIDLDHEISMVMLSDPPSDPDGSIQPNHFSMNPFKLPKL